MLKQVDHPACGALLWLDLLDHSPPSDVKAVVPLAKAACATSAESDAQRDPKPVDYVRVMKTVLDGGYRGYVGIAYRGRQLDEFQGIRATKALLERATDSGPLPS